MIRFFIAMIIIFLVPQTTTVFAEAPVVDSNLSGEQQISQPVTLSPTQNEEKALPFMPAINDTLTMEEAVRLGLNNSLDIDIARSEVNIRNASLRRARGAMFPIILLGSQTFVRAGETMTLMNPEMNMTMGDSTVFQDFNATLRVPIFTGGKIRGGIQAARFSRDASEAELQQNIVQSAFDIKLAYLDALMAKQAIQIHTDHITIQNIILKSAEAKYRAGRTILADVLRVRTAIADLNVELNNERINLNNALYDLKAAIGIDMTSNIAAEDLLIYRPVELPTLRILNEMAINTNPQVSAAELRIKESTANKRVARSRYFPQVSGQVTGNLRIPDDPPAMGSGVIGMLTVALPVLDRDRTGEIAVATAEINRAEKQLRLIMLEISRDVAQLANEASISRENVIQTEPVIAQAEEDVRLIRRRYEVGRSTQIEVQDSMEELRTAQLRKYRSIYDYEVAKARLAKALGLIFVDNICK